MPVFQPLVHKTNMFDCDVKFLVWLIVKRAMFFTYSLHINYSNRGIIMCRGTRQWDDTRLESLNKSVGVRLCGVRPERRVKVKGEKKSRSVVYANLPKFDDSFALT